MTKKILLSVLFSCSIVFAQGPVNRYTDSTFTATQYWKVISLQDGYRKHVEIFDSSATNIQFCTRAADTVGAAASTSNKWRPTVYGGTAFQLVAYAGQYIYIRSTSTSTARVSVRTY